MKMIYSISIWWLQLPLLFQVQLPYWGKLELFLTSVNIIIFFPLSWKAIVFAAVLKFTYEEKAYMGAAVTNMEDGRTQHGFLKRRSHAFIFM